MDCDVEYICLTQVIGPLVYHNIKINGDKWHYPENIGTSAPASEDFIISKVKRTHCRERDLKLVGFVKDWMQEC